MVSTLNVSDKPWRAPQPAWYRAGVDPDRSARMTRRRAGRQGAPAGARTEAGGRG